MFNKQQLFLLLSIALLITAVLLLPDEAMARAGGGSSKGGGILGLILWPFILIYSGIITYIAATKNKQAKALLRQMGFTPFPRTVELRVIPSV